MKLSIPSLVIIIGLLFIGAYSTLAQNYRDSLDISIKSLYHNNLPAIAVAVVNQDGVLYQKTMGYANLETQLPYTSKTIQCIASTTKTTIAFAVMKLQQEGKLSLDSPINQYLPFKVTNPYHKDSIIRVRHLVTHTSGIRDTENNYDSRVYYFTDRTNLEESKFTGEDRAYFENMRTNQKLSLKEYFRNILSDEGNWYDKNTFHDKPFGQHYEYSNVAAGLTALIVEEITQTSFEEYIDVHLFQKLKMNRTSFDELSIAESQLAKSYLTEKVIASPSLGFINYPDGGMNTSLEELSLYLIEMMKGYNGRSHLLKPETFKKMMSPMLTEEVANTNPQRTFNNIGVFWQIDDDGSVKHYGGNPHGGTVYFSFNPSTKVGKILMTNLDASSSRETIVEFISIWRILDKYSDKL